MAFLLTVLRVLGILLLIVLAVLLVTLLLVLFVPFGYSLSGAVKDPEGSSEPLHLQLKRDVSFAGEMRWLFGAVRAKAAYDGQGRLEVRAFGFPVPLEKLLGRGKGEKKEEEKPPAREEKKSLEERIDGILDRIGKLYARIDDAFYVLGTDCGVRARQTLSFRLLSLLKKVLPSRWGLTGVLGFGDPARSAKVYEAQGFLYPVTAGHVAIDAEFELYRYDLEGAAQGGIRLFPFLYTGIRILLDRDVRRTIRKLRRGSRPQHLLQ